MPLTWIFLNIPLPSGGDAHGGAGYSQIAAVAADAGHRLDLFSQDYSREFDGIEGLRKDTFQGGNMAKKDKISTIWQIRNTNAD